tara:strand:+ start:917 stop:1261 length:345 start_codon:yes stop_codon:yes gene_type:complete
MQHSMRLNKSPFERIQNGTKIIELRLFDEKRQKLNLGDTITFTNLDNSSETLTVDVTGLLRYPTFSDLFDDFPMSYFDLDDDYSKEKFIESMYKIYTQEDETKYGVLGIKIKII